MNSFKINDETFEIAQVYIDALLDDENENLFFGLVIECKMVDDKTLPLIDSETILKVKKHEIKKWQDIAGRVIEWGKCSRNSEKPHAKFVNCYKKSFRSSFIYNAKIELLNVNDKMRLKLNGLCDSKFNGTSMKNLILEMETDVSLRCIQIGNHETEEIARKTLNPYLDSEDFKYTVSDNDRGTFWYL